MVTYNGIAEVLKLLTAKERESVYNITRSKWCPSLRNNDTNTLIKVILNLYLQRYPDFDISPEEHIWILFSIGPLPATDEADRFWAERKESYYTKEEEKFPAVETQNESEVKQSEIAILFLYFTYGICVAIYFYLIGTTESSYILPVTLVSVAGYMVFLLINALWLRNKIKDNIIIFFGFLFFITTAAFVIAQMIVNGINQYLP